MRTLSFGLVFGALAVLTGCPPENFPNLVGGSSTLVDINRIRNNTDLTPQQERDQLAALGFDTNTINALLSTVRLGNQGGGDLRTAYTKVTSGELNLMTPDEVQYYADGASAVDPNTVDVVVSDAQAQAIVDLFQQNSIRTSPDLSNWLGNVANEVPASIPSNTLKPLFIDFDPKLLLPKLP